MSPREIIYRAVLFTRIRCSKYAFALPLQRPVRNAAVGTSAALFPHLVDREATAKVARNIYHWTPARADRFLAHEFSFFSLSEKKFGDAIQWNRDYFHGIVAPLQYGPAMDYRDFSLCGDIKYLWEPNRFLHLPELAKACYLTGDAIYGDEVLRQVDSWIEACPYPRGANWASALEVSIRLINWCIAHELLSTAPGRIFERNADRYQKWMHSVYDHLHYLRGHRSRYSSANNHLIGELAGEFIGSMCFSIPGSNERLAEAHDQLEAEALRQHWPDGVNKEQAVRYQAFVFEFLLLAAIAGTRNGHSFSKAYWETLENSADFIRSLEFHFGPIPVFGDDDDGRVISLDDSPDVYRTMLAATARLTGRECFGSVRADSSEQAFWLLGDGPAMLNGGTKSAAPKDMFPDGGLYIMKGGDAALLFDCGPLGYLSLAAHGHADALSILLSYKGLPFLVDSGTFAYHTHREWRDFFRGTFAHNTIRVDGRDQSEIGGNFMWLQKARARLLRAEPDFLAGSHDGYQRLDDPVSHTREIRFDPETNAFLVSDLLEGRGRHSFDLTFTVAPECRCTAEMGAVRLRNGGVSVSIHGDPVLGDPRLLTGSLQPIGGWFSPGLDRKTVTTMACWSGAMERAVRITTRIQLEPQ